MDFENNLGRNVGRIHYLFSQKLNVLLRNAATGITVDQFRMLTQLWKEDGISQQKLALYVKRDRASVTRMVDILEEQEIIRRVADKDDRRINLIFLTPKGKELEAIASNAAQEVLDIAQQDLSNTQKTTLSELLQKVIANLKA